MGQQWQQEPYQGWGGTEVVGTVLQPQWLGQAIASSFA